MKTYSKYPTIGVLAGWQWYESVTLHRYLESVFQGLRAIIQRYDMPETLFYLDPPYVRSTRTVRWSHISYMHEMDDNQHVQLTETLRSIQGMAIISGYPSELYRELYRGWQQVTTQARINTVRNGGKLATECLWISPQCQGVLAQKVLL